MGSGAVGLALFTVGLFWAADSISWWRGWVYVALLGASQGAAGLILWRRDPDLLRRRGRLGPGTPAWDYVLLGAFGIGYVATIVVAALDSGRFGWSTLPAWTVIPGAVAMAAGSALTTWAMAVNTHFEKTPV